MRIRYPPQSEHIYEAIEIVIVFNSQRKCIKRCFYNQDIIQNIKFDE